MSRYHAAATTGQNGQRKEISAEVAGHLQLVETFPPKNCIFEKMTTASYFVPVEAIKKSALLAKCFQDTQFQQKMSLI